MMYFAFLFLCQVLEIQCYFKPYRTNQFGLAVFQVPTSHMWPAATILDSRALKHISVTLRIRGVT